MNERIKELAEQHAGSILMDLVMPDAGMPERIEWNIGCTTSHLEKFAESIIKECVGLAKLAVLSNTSMDVIKEHFGVE